jgi:DNA-binding NtrC family response regulator
VPAVRDAEYFDMTWEKVPKPMVLVVDDEPLIRWSLSEGLADVGYPVKQAASGAEARQAIAACGDNPLVVLLDLRLPDVTDLSLLREIRNLRPDVPVVMITAHGTAEDAREASHLGAFRFVSKPFDVTEIVRLVSEAWASAR